MPAVPDLIRTARLTLRPYRAEDAEALQPLLADNLDHLKSWIPQHVWEPVDLPARRARLAKYAADFAADVEWRYSARSVDESKIVGSVGLFPRNATMRVRLADADRVEIGYWVRRDLSGQGYATELTRAMIDLARTMPGMTAMEIRCDARNIASAAIPARLGFQLVETDGADGAMSQVWSMPI